MQEATLLSAHDKIMHTHPTKRNAKYCRAECAFARDWLLVVGGFSDRLVEVGFAVLFALGRFGWHLFLP